ncbi:MAG: ribose-phosphate diphosphokinase [Saprospiraceae bacterium]|nr:ribose-phosphate diphosphokinase [Saprospiraceae bacterium]
MTLNLDKSFFPLGDQRALEYEAFVFSGGEPHIKIKPFKTTEVVTITHRIRSFNDVGMICVALDALQRMGVEKIALFIPYFPAARQDRLMIEGEPLTVKIYADLINQLQLSKVTVFDPHSEVTPALLNNCETISNHSFINKVCDEIGSEVKLISPDGGALKKIYKLSTFLGGMDVVECSKTRDVKTGHLAGFKVYADDLGGIDCLIVDDICDGGGTFIGLAEELKKKNAGKLYLAVSHGIFSKGFGELNVFEKIFTTNSFRDIDDAKVSVINLSKILG